jgi:predicted small lipoprotein YifL
MENMRKYISVLLAAILLFCVAGCSGGQKKGPDETPLSDTAPSAGTEAVKTETKSVPEREAGQKSMSEHTITFN